MKIPVVVIGFFILLGSSLYIYPVLKEGLGHNPWFPMPFMFLPIAIIISLGVVGWDVYRWRQTRATLLDVSVSRLTAWVVVVLVSLLAVLALGMMVAERKGFM